ncbi:MAG: beta-N-acetylhexosaminidase [Planctomycetota bacterium]
MITTLSLISCILPASEPALLPSVTTLTPATEPVTTTNAELRAALDGCAPLPGITVNNSDNSITNREGYRLSIDADGISISASDPRGAFYGRQTLAQLIDHYQGALPALTITDAPRYQWRGLLLDSGRQYHQPATIKRLLDHMARYKLNVLHWHLTDHHGWRMEVPGYPRLTDPSVDAEIGPWPEQDGYYDAATIRDLVAYAAERHITIVPEIEIPGHSVAAQIAYPVLNCTQQAPSPRGRMGREILCAGREDTFTFIEAALDQTCALFPSTYIHIGGDEAFKGNWQNCADCQARRSELGLADDHALQVWMNNRVADYLADQHGRRAICWGDLLLKPGPELSANITVQWWQYRGAKDLGLRTALSQGRDVIASPNNQTYLNFPVVPWAGYRPGRLLSLEDAYAGPSLDCAHGVAGDQAKHILGITACLWTDYNVREAYLDVRLFPRLLALAEHMWRAGERLPWPALQSRIDTHRPWLEARGITLGPINADDYVDGVYGPAPNPLR